LLLLCSHYGLESESGFLKILLVQEVFLRLKENEMKLKSEKIKWKMIDERQRKNKQQLVCGFWDLIDTSERKKTGFVFCFLLFLMILDFNNGFEVASLKNWVQENHIS